MDYLSKAYLKYQNEGASRLFDELMDICLFHIDSITPYSFYWNVIPNYYKYRIEFDVDNYDSPVDPFKIIWVDPDEIYRMTQRPLPAWDDIISLVGSVKKGDWDQKQNIRVKEGYEHRKKYDYSTIHAEFFEESIFYKSLKKHIENDVEWEETKLYNRSISGIREGEEVYKGITTKSELLNRLNSIDTLHDSIKENGIQTQYDIHKNKKRFIRLLGDEILVDIGRDGNFRFVEGRTRLSIAKVLNIDLVPVVVLVRHKRWMELREKVYKGHLNYFDHPDFTEFKSEREV